ncbi:hypothetical protein C7427_1184 [Pantoea ananatis]|nr:hypothetical protein C7427_1184 [Pantoea ananatis]
MKPVTPSYRLTNFLSTTARYVVYHECAVSFQKPHKSSHLSFLPGYPGFFNSPH